MKAVVLGASGMLGHVVAQELNSSGLDVVEVSRSGKVPWDAQSQTFDELANQLALGAHDWLVNCIGWIPQKSTGDWDKDSKDAGRLNASLLEEISKTQSASHFGWIQIGTDCVFNGVSGPYHENSTKDAFDLYGASKVAGEKFTSRSHLIRTSIVGPDAANRSGLFEWFRTLPKDAVVSGFTNQLWNGVSTRVFARLTAGLIVNNRREPIRQHLVPLGFVSKYELLCIFRDVTDRGDVVIVPTEAPRSLDRRLITKQPAGNEHLWRVAGYSRPQTIEEMCREFGNRIVER